MAALCLLTSLRASFFATLLFVALLLQVASVLQVALDLLALRLVPGLPVGSLARRGAVPPLPAPSALQHVIARLSTGLVTHAARE